MSRAGWSTVRGAEAVALIAKSVAVLRQAGTVDAQLAPLSVLLEEAALRVKDAGHSLLQYLDALELDPQRADAIERRLAAVEELARKHRVNPEALLDRQAELSAIDREVVRGTGK